MHLPTDAPIPDTPAQRKADRARLIRALNLSLAFVLVLVAVFSAQGSFDVRAFTVQPWSAEGLIGLLTAPLLHGSIEHLAANATSLLLLGTLAGAVYPKATIRALPIMWLGSGLGAWLLGDPGSYHLGASGVTHGLMFLVMSLGLLRRDRASIAAAFIAFLLYGGMLLTVLPREVGVSWQAHLGGAVAGVIGAFVFKLSDPLPPRKRYSWEDEEDAQMVPLNDELEPPSPGRVPVLWNRPEPRDVQTGVVLRFPGRGNNEE
ncbi:MULTISPECIES: rhomboid family intramembrane serine protease [unclassified Lysobacter]|uniref:rhomboid family intramembrane serine protease n=1 Tax=unclassified Lysobacter TaxID=2635362 RepID=UPI001BE582E9|nr:MULTISPECIES: rhomboid family intramembrane serine protease [unclassified Lysobacter]MBT2746874.1 rhomboid family intramembrane serine protease [Lysobacter sp. ISL-42]MBT2753621.1 rhomboid family intramembrane serine protease [Lysobacter sp. ISL-50]MBT2779763.1 rhomboid family intramembrane serine protease [Lysobacter sp. ISL-54]MBT2784369.1 rhomboid family intramembrane serine protease [Lysobacter sp. ISL-52]